MNALLLVDIQNDFLPGGALPVPGGEYVVPLANELMTGFDLVVATVDWHPRNHDSFASQYPGRKAGEVITLAGLPQILWPDHCVQHTFGAQFAPGLKTAGIQYLIHKGTDRTVDSYSGFFDNGRRNASGLAKLLREQGVEDLYVIGLATDYCVKATAIDAADLGFKVHVIREGVRGVDIRKGDCDRAFAQMAAKGVEVMSVEELMIFA